SLRRLYDGSAGGKGVEDFVRGCGRKKRHVLYREQRTSRGSPPLHHDLLWLRAWKSHVIETQPRCLARQSRRLIAAADDHEVQVVPAAIARDLRDPEYLPAVVDESERSGVHRQLFASRPRGQFELAVERGDELVVGSVRDHFYFFESVSCSDLV